MSREQITVLNVDDYEPGRYSRSRVLRNAGFTVIEASCGQEALDIVRRVQPHLVVLDVHLPDMSGFEVCRRIKSDPDLGQPLVLHLSATSVTSDHKVQGLAAGADSYLVEPVDPEELIANLQALLRLKRAEEEVRQANLTLEAIVSASPLAIVAVDLEGRVRRWNAAAEHIFGWTEAEVTGQALPAIPAHDEAAFARQVQRAAAGESSSGLECRAARRDGSILDVSLSLAPLREVHGRIDGVLALVEDISERKRIEREVARLYEEARQANQTKDEFLATLSHELRTPLNAMVGWVRLLRTGALDDARKAHAVEVIERNTVVQVRLIEDILDVSRIVSGKLRLRSTPVDLVQVLEAAADAIRPAAEIGGVALHVTVEPSTPALTTIGDPQRLQQVISNLLSNAVKFTSAGGRVDVTLRARHDHAEFVVRDTGMGIDPALLPFVFERFRQGDSSSARVHGGLGLGLAIARYLAEAHRGHLTAASDGPGRGSTFVFTLPLVAVALPTASATSEPAPQDVTLRGLRVLVVEDDEDSRSLIDTVLGAHGVEVRLAASADEAMVVLEHEPVDVLVADIGLPHADGFTLLRRVRALEHHATLPALAVTGFASEDDRLRVRAAGFAAHLAKPFDPDTLLGVLGRLAHRV